jgi:hypothetical protein
MAAQLEWFKSPTIAPNASFPLVFQGDASQGFRLTKFLFGNGFKVIQRLTLLVTTNAIPDGNGLCFFTPTIGLEQEGAAK